MSYKTKEEISKYHRDIWYPKNKEKRKAMNNAWRRKKNDEFQKYKNSLSCIFCPESVGVCLDFHHLDPTQKDFELSHFANVSRARFEKEIKKCIVVCSNCHRKIHAGLLDIRDIKPL